MKRFISISALFAVLIFSGCSKDSPTSSVPDPVASFVFNGDLVSPATIVFTNQSQNADRFHWDFGDGSITTTENPTHIFTTAGTYSVRLIASSSQTGKSASTIQFLQIDPSKAFLDSVLIEDIPFVDDAGASWDIGSGPDLFWTLERSNGSVLLTSSIINNLTPQQLPVLWTLRTPFHLSLTEELTFLLYDYDDVSSNDLITGGRFDLIDHSTFPTEIYWDNPIKSFKMTAYIHWE